MAALNENQLRELCRKIEQYILKDGYFIFDIDDWDGLNIEYKQFTHGKNYEYADYTEITVTLDGYNVTDKLQVKYNFIKSVYAGRTGDSYRVYYKRENSEKDGGHPYNMNEAAKFIANKFIGLVEDKIMDKKLEARISRLEKLLSANNKSKNAKNESFNTDALEKAVKGLAMADRALGVFCDSSDTPDVDHVDNLRAQIEGILDELADMLAFGE